MKDDNFQDTVNEIKQELAIKSKMMKLVYEFEEALKNDVDDRKLYEASHLSLSSIINKPLKSLVNLLMKNNSHFRSKNLDIDRKLQLLNQNQMILAGISLHNQDS